MVSGKHVRDGELQWDAAGEMPPSRKGASVMIYWFNDDTMERSARRQRQRGVRLDEETRGILLRRAAYMDAADENLVRLAIDGKHSYRQMTRVMRLASAGGTHRRVRLLIRRLREPVVAALLDFPGNLPADYREIGIRHFLRRQPVRDIAAEMDRAMTDVYRVNAYLRGWCKATEHAWASAALATTRRDTTRDEARAGAGRRRRAEVGV